MKNGRQRRTSLRLKIDGRGLGLGIFAIALAVAAPGVAGAQAAHADATPARWYLRAALGGADSRSATLLDRNCRSTSPPALFGCGEGGDGRRLAAPGTFGDSLRGELGLGLRLTPSLRAELFLAALPDLTFAGEANFPRVTGGQRVTAELQSEVAFVTGLWDLAPSFGRPNARWQPFVGAGVGVARHHLGRVTYRFPGLAPNAVTITRGGDRSDFAWQATAGLGVRLGPRATLELAYRYEDLGTVSTEPGSALIVRSRGSLRLDVAPTAAKLRLHSVLCGVRWAL